MPQAQSNISIEAPGIKGINLEDSPIGGDPYFCEIAENCVFDKFGRLGSRKGQIVQTDDASALGTDSIERIGEFLGTDGTSIIFSAGNNKLFSGTTTLTDETPVGPTITADDWSMHTLNDDMFFVQPGHDILVYDHSGGAIVTHTAHPNYGATTTLQADCALAAYGRMWFAKDDTIYWSDLLIGPDLDNGSSGSLNVTEVWPHGSDTIVALAAHNNFLIIFGNESTIVYGSSAYDGNIGDPAADLTLVDTIAGIGCAGRHTIANIGPDLIFLDKSGLRSFGRVMQQKSMPIGEMSANIRTQLRSEVSINATAGSAPVGMYDPDEGFYLLNLPTVPHVYCFDMRKFLEDNVARVTTFTGWTDTVGMCSTQDGTIYLGTNDGISKYSGAQDNGNYYMFRYYTRDLDFGEGHRMKFPKQVDWIIIDGSGQLATTYWAYDFTKWFKKEPFTLNVGVYDKYNTEGDEYNLTAIDPDDPTEYYGAGAFSRYKTNINGQGNYLQVGIEIKVNGYLVSLQNLQIQTLLGRIA